MEKVITINSCRECLLCNMHQATCIHPEVRIKMPEPHKRLINSFNEIPAFCPYPTVHEFCMANFNLDL